jgi:hypothetical protein
VLDAISIPEMNVGFDDDDDHESLVIASILQTFSNSGSYSL